MGCTIEELEGGAYVGNIFLSDSETANRTKVLGMGLSPQFWNGRGYGTEALTCVVAYAFKFLGFHCIELEVIATNDAAIALYRDLLVVA